MVSPVICQDRPETARFGEPDWLKDDFDNENSLQDFAKEIQQFEPPAELPETTAPVFAEKPKLTPKIAAKRFIFHDKENQTATNSSNDRPKRKNSIKVDKRVFTVTKAKTPVFQDITNQLNEKDEKQVYSLPVKEPAYKSLQVNRSLAGGLTRRKIDFSSEPKISPRNGSTSNSIQGYSKMDRDTLQRKLQQALLDKDHEKELRLKALNEKDSLQKDLLSKEIEIGNL